MRLLIFLLLPLVCAAQQDYRLLNSLNDNLSATILQDGFSPPVASRIYAYSNIAAFEAISNHTDFPTLSPRLNCMPPSPARPNDVNQEIVVIRAFSRVASALVYRVHMIDNYEKETLARYEGANKAASIAYGDLIAKGIIEWAMADGYKQTRSMPIFQPDKSKGKWQPTPPNFGKAIEPHWDKLRPFILTSADQYTPPPPTTFSTEEDSPFYEETMEVYESVKSADSTRELIARYWDCNPMVPSHQGHLMFVKRQLTPGGHWIGICGQACEQEQLSLAETTRAYSHIAITMADAFISCWDEKYRSNLIRPETYIYEHIDKEWKPILVTPEFPEYTSGHSVVSASGAFALTQLFGDNFAFTDSVEVPFGLPPRSFESFDKAAEEAAISRMYGGIHYRPAIENGIIQGRSVGKYSWGRLTGDIKNPGCDYKAPKVR